MKPGFLNSICLAALLAGTGATRAGLTPEKRSQLPPPAGHQVDFAKEVQPLLEASCIKCHGRGKAKGGFRLDDREAFLKGGDSGAAAEIGKSAESYFIELVSGLSEDDVMPKKGSKLTAEQVGVLRAWIDQGLKWDNAVNFGKLPARNLEPRSPALPALAKKGAGNPVDLILKPYFEQHKVKPGKPVDDTAYARRVYFDIVGLPPEPSELDAFLADRRKDKRERLVRMLLAEPTEADRRGKTASELEPELAQNRHRYAQHWLTFWNDALRNYYKGTGDIDSGRKAITSWLYSALATNKPYNQFVAELVSPNEYSEGFSKGIVWRGAINASQTPQMQVAQSIGQVFMGVNLKCASCHDSFINDWTLADAYGLASVYADEPLEMVVCDKPTGKKAEVKFIFSDLGKIDAAAPKKERMRQLADIITSRKDGRLTRTMVNRLWAQFMGRGLVEPVDEMDNAAWNSDLLDWLAEDLVQHGYDLKHTIRVILTSQAYQLPAAMRAEELEKDYVFTGPTLRRLSAEQWVDSISAVSGAWYDAPANSEFNLYEGAGLTELQQLPGQARWVWSEKGAAAGTKAGTVYFLRTIVLPEIPDEAGVVGTCDNSFTLYVNGANVASSSDHNKPKLTDIRSKLVKGTNVFAVAAVNDASAKAADGSTPDNPAGLWVYARLRKDNKITGVQSVWDFGTDAQWSWTKEKVENWEKPGAKLANLGAAEVIGEVDAAPWKLKSKLLTAVSCLNVTGEVRASLVNADPLITALGRPNREQTTTTRSGLPTTLQALELTNGGTLADRLKKGAEKVLEEQGGDPEKLVRTVFRRALARQPSRDELSMARELVGTPAKREGVEDLLWAVSMLPEFQLIY